MTTEFLAFEPEDFAEQFIKRNSMQSLYDKPLVDFFIHSDNIPTQYFKNDGSYSGETSLYYDNEPLFVPEQKL